MKKFIFLALTLICSTSLFAQETFIAEIKMFAGNFAPRGWAFCDGQLLPISGNEALFSLIGTTYGGDGRTNFALPDLRGRAPIHAGTGPGLSTRRLGEKGGVETVTLATTEMPNHNHTALINADSLVATSDSPQGALVARNAGATPQYGLIPNTKLNAGAVTISSTGGSQAHYNMQPYIAVNYIIALVGYYPSRN